MKGRTVVLDTLRGRPAAALLVDGRLEDLLVDAAGGPPVPGTIFRAKVERPMKGQGGVFLALPEGKAFLRRTRGLSPGSAALVQVMGYAEPGKAVPATDRLLFKSRYAIVTPAAPGLNVSRTVRDEDERVRLLEIAEKAMNGVPHGLILRSAAAGVEAGAIAEDVAVMRALAADVLAAASGPPERLLGGPGARNLAWREWAEPDPDEVVDAPGAFLERGVLDAVDALASPEVALGGGASMAVERTRALVAVDVNTGGDTSPAAGTTATRAALRALPRELRLRGLGGQVAIDPAPMPKAERPRAEQVLKAVLRSDPVETTFAGWTPLGHVELQRKRDRQPLTESLCP